MKIELYDSHTGKRRFVGEYEIPDTRSLPDTVTVGESVYRHRTNDDHDPAYDLEESSTAGKFLGPYPECSGAGRVERDRVLRVLAHHGAAANIVADVSGGADY